MINPTKKKYRKKSAHQQKSQISMSTISLNTSLRLTETSYLKRNQSTLEIHDLDNYMTQQLIKEFKFQYNFNQYLRMFLVKMLPPKNPEIKICPKEKSLRGPQVQSQQFIKKIKSQFEVFAMKVIKFKANADIEQIEFHLEKKYELKIYKKKFLQLTVEDVIKNYKFFQQSRAFLNRIESQQLILIRVQKKFQKDCLEDINVLFNNSAQVQQSRLNTSRTTAKNNKSSSEQEIIQDQNEPTYYEKQSVREVQTVHGQRSGNKFTKKFQEPTEDDSVSVVEAKRSLKTKRQSIKYEQPEKKRKQDVILTREYQSQYFDRKNFEGWLKNVKILSKNVEIIEHIDPYADDDKNTAHTYKIQLLESSNTSKDQLIEALDVYLKFRKVIFIKLKNQIYKKQLIQKHKKEDQALTVQFIEGYKSPKWPESQMWKHIIKKDYSKMKKSANTQYFELFFLQGLKNLVLQSQKDIRKELQNEPSDDSTEQILIKLDQLCDVIRNNQRLKDMIKEYAQKMMETFTHCCTLVTVQYPLTYIKLLVQVKFEHQEQFNKNVKNQIMGKIKSEIKVHQQKYNYPIMKYVYQKIEKNVILIKKNQKSFTYVATIHNLPTLMNEINNIFNSLNNTTEKDIQVSDKIIVKRLQEKMNEIKKQKEFNQIKCNYLSQQSKFKLYGPQYLLATVLKRLEQCKQEILEKRISYIQIVKKKEADLLEEGTFLKDIYEKYQIMINTRKSELACKITLAKNTQNFKKKNLLIVKSKSLDYAPYGSVIAFKNIHQVELFKNYFIKTFRNYINKHKQESFNENTRKYTFLLKNKETGEVLKDALAVNPNISNHVIMIMPEKGKQAFVKAIIKVLLQQKPYIQKEVTVMIIQYGQSTDIQKQINISPYIKGKKMKLKDQVITKYYVQDNSKKYYYSESGNRKILIAKEKGFSQIILNNDDLNVTHESHQFYPQNLTIVHLQSTKSFPVKINGTKVEFTLKNQIYQIPPVLATKILNSLKGTSPIRLSLGVYEVDLSSMKQKNLFSDYQRKLLKEETIIKADVNQDQIQAFYNYKIAQIEYSYFFQQNLMANFTSSRTEVVEFLSKSVKEKQISYGEYKNIQITQLQTIRSGIEQDQETQFFYNHTKKIITFKTLDDTTANRCEQMIKMFLNNFNERDPNKIKYPDYWEPQKEDIEILQVKQNTPQFQNVQAKFTVNKIKHLLRIQNKIIYKKYFEESIFLQTLNRTKIKKMQLFHGTRATNPEQIYRDKQESFNINYSSDNNLLGKGIYFAEKSEYSNNYRYTQVTKIVKPGGVSLYNMNNQFSMFLCEVLVGSSQKCLQHNGAIKDTSYKDPVNKIRFESMTDFLNNSNIYVVYKSRRAYPLYLIKY